MLLFVNNLLDLSWQDFLLKVAGLREARLRAVFLFSLSIFLTPWILMNSCGEKLQTDSSPGLDLEKTDPKPVKPDGDVPESGLDPEIDREIKVLAIDYPPYTSPDLESGGMSFKILEAAMEGSGYTLKPVFMPPARCLEEFTRGRYALCQYNNDSFFDNKTMVRLNIQRVIYTFFYNKDFGEIKWTTLEDLAGKRVAMLRVGSARRTQRDIVVKSGMIAVDLDTLDQAFRMLESGKVDLALSVDLSGLHLIQKLFPGNESMVPTRSVYRLIQGGPWFKLDHPDGVKLLKAFVEGRERIIRDGTLVRIQEMYYGKGNVPTEAIETVY